MSVSPGSSGSKPPPAKKVRQSWPPLTFNSLCRAPLPIFLQTSPTSPSLSSIRDCTWDFWAMSRWRWTRKWWLPITLFHITTKTAIINGSISWTPRFTPTWPYPDKPRVFWMRKTWTNSITSAPFNYRKQFRVWSQSIKWFTSSSASFWISTSTMDF